MRFQLVLGRKYYSKQYEINDYLKQYSSNGKWELHSPYEEADWWMFIMFGYTNIWFNDLETTKKFMSNFYVDSDYTLMELHDCEYIIIEEKD